LIELTKKIRTGNCENFTIIIPTWNNLEYLKLCIKSLRNNSVYNNQIIVAVNEGHDGTVSWLEEQLDIDYIYSQENLGVCYAVNVCRPHVKTNYIAYLNDDMYVCPGWDEELKYEIDKLGTNNFFLSASLIEPKKNTNPNYVAEIMDFGDSVETFNEDGLLKVCNKINIKNWKGSSWPPNVVHKDTWDMVGGYSVEFSPGMYSDPDFSMKLWHAGIRIFMGVGNSKVYHFGEKSTGRIKKNKGSDTFLKKWGLTARTYYTEYLQLGKDFDGSYPDVIKLGSLSKLRNRLKIIFKSL